MNFAVAWLAQGKLRVKKPGEPPRIVESRFAQGIRERAAQARRRHDWKTCGEGPDGQSRAVLWGRAPKAPEAVRIAITSFSRGAVAGQMLYSVETDDLCAVLCLENYGEEERRLWNKNDKRLDHLCVSPEGAVACSVHHPNDTASLAVRLDDESAFSDVTEGDCVDTAPRWVPGPGRRLVFQSAGVGRDRQGNFADLGPVLVQQLDIDTGDMEVLAEDPSSDLLAPQVDPDGALYYIRRPYTSLTGYPLQRSLADFFVAPFRYLCAGVRYLKLFAVMYVHRGLTGAASGDSCELTLDQPVVWEKPAPAQPTAWKEEEAPDLVPDTWHLVRQTPGGPAETIVKGVLAFDLAPDGSIVYSNGSAIFVLDPAGKTERVHVEDSIDQVTVLC